MGSIIVRTKSSSGVDNVPRTGFGTEGLSGLIRHLLCPLAPPLLECGYSPIPQIRLPCSSGMFSSCYKMAQGNDTENLETYFEAFTIHILQRLVAWPSLLPESQRVLDNPSLAWLWALGACLGGCQAFQTYRRQDYVLYSDWLWSSTLFHRQFGCSRPERCCKRISCWDSEVDDPEFERARAYH